MSNTYTVAKPFKTPTRRFAIGQEVDASDVDGPVPFGDWVRKGYITEPVKTAEPEPEAVAATTDAPSKGKGAPKPTEPPAA